LDIGSSGRFGRESSTLFDRSLVAASMQTGVEIHLHQGKPGVRAANTHCVGQAFVVADQPKSRLLERLFEQD
jgi:hypothetical protein